MSELLPTVQVERVREGLLDYLGTTFSLADEDARSALLDFLEDPETGIFKGPYLRLRLPFRPADDGWRSALDWYEGFPPYGHQAAAFRRLTSADLGPGEAAAAADPGHHRHRVRQDRGVPAPDRRPRAARQARTASPG